MFEIDLDGKCTYINQVKAEKCKVSSGDFKHQYNNGVCTVCGMWQNWKLFKDLNKEERELINLATPSKKYVILDKDFKDYADKQIEDDYKNTAKELEDLGYYNYIGDRSAHGWHVFIPFSELLNENDETILEIRKAFIERFRCDAAKASLNGVISIPGKPHFKSDKVCKIYRHPSLGTDKLPEGMLSTARSLAEKHKELRRVNSNLSSDVDFKEYFNNDKLWLFLKNHDHIIPEGYGRNDILLKNLAIGVSKTGLKAEEIKKIVEPVLRKTMPDIPYKQFVGWLTKSMSGKISDYNFFEINNWSKAFFNNELYDLKDLKDSKQIPNGRVIHFLTDKEFDELKVGDISWLVDKWIIEGDIAFIAGKAASFKSTTCLHFANAIAEGKLVFNEFATKKSRVLYLNEENNINILKATVKKIKNGLQQEGKISENIFYASLENIRVDRVEDVDILIKFIVDNQIEVLFLDSFRRFFSGKENDADVINQIFNVLKVIRSKCKKLTIIAIHHTKKGSSAEHDERDMLRGSSDIINAGDATIIIERQTSKPQFVISQAKSRGSEEIRKQLVRINILENQGYYFEYKGAVQEDDKVMSATDNTAIMIKNYLIEKGIRTFASNDLVELKNSIPSATFTRGLAILKEEGTIKQVVGGKYARYTVDSSVFEEKTQKTEDSCK